MTKSQVSETYSGISLQAPNVGASSMLVTSSFLPPYSFVCAYDGTYAGLSLAQAKVSEFANMQPNWDGYGAEPVGPITSGNAAQALNILSYQLPMPDITPNPNGTLSLEWETGAGCAHMEIGRTQFSLYIQQCCNSPTLYFAGSPGEIDAAAASLLHASLYAPLVRSKPISQINGYRDVR